MLAVRKGVGLDRAVMRPLLAACTAGQWRDDLVLESIDVEHAFPWAREPLWENLARAVHDQFLVGADIFMSWRGCVNPVGIKPARGARQSSVEPPAMWEVLMEDCFARVTDMTEMWALHSAALHRCPCPGSGPGGSYPRRRNTGPPHRCHLG